MTLIEWQQQHADDIDAMFALYVFCANYHEGQWSEKYSIMSQMNCNLRDYAWNAIQEGVNADTEWFTAREIYLELVELFGE